MQRRRHILTRTPSCMNDKTLDRADETAAKIGLLKDEADRFAEILQVNSCRPTS